MQPIVTLTLSLDDARELYRAMVTRLLVQETLRREQGLEAVDAPPYLDCLEQALGLGGDQAGKQGETIEDELWQHAWLAFTDEWAWHRAKQDIRKELGKRGLKRLSNEELEQATEARYKERFEAYVREIQLPGHEEGESCDRVLERHSAKQKPTPR